MHTNISGFVYFCVIEHYIHSDSEVKRQQKIKDKLQEILVVTFYDNRIIIQFRCRRNTIVITQ